MTRSIVLAAILALPIHVFAAEFGIQAPPDWTAETTDTPVTDAVIDSWFTENGTTITSGVFVGPLAAGELRNVNADVFLGTGRTICLNATVERQGQPATRVAAVPACGTFPLFRLLPPTLLAP